ncbi:unnamed protein product [Closterium sp. Naga37s-1]|nr:unnamed protein product [Closterium sp. Naga37s-1]
MDALSAPFMPLEAAPDGRKGKGKKRREAAEAPSGASDAEAKRAKQADAEQQGAGDGGGEAAQPLGESEEQAQTQAVQFVGLRSVRRNKEQQKGREREKRERYVGAGTKAGAGARGGGGKQRRKKATKSSVVYLGRLPHGFYEDELHGTRAHAGAWECRGRNQVRVGTVRISIVPGQRVPDDGFQRKGIGASVQFGSALRSLLSFSRRDLWKIEKAHTRSSTASLLPPLCVASSSCLSTSSPLLSPHALSLDPLCVAPLPPLRIPLSASPYPRAPPPVRAGFLSQFGEIEQLRVVRNPKVRRGRAGQGGGWRRTGAAGGEWERRGEKRERKRKGWGEEKREGGVGEGRERRGRGEWGGEGKEWGRRGTEGKRGFGEREESTEVYVTFSLPSLPATIPSLPLSLPPLPFHFAPSHPSSPSPHPALPSTSPPACVCGGACGAGGEQTGRSRHYGYVKFAAPEVRARWAAPCAATPFLGVAGWGEEGSGVASMHENLPHLTLLPLLLPLPSLCPPPTPYPLHSTPPLVAAIVAECMDNYLLFGHLLKTHLVPAARADRDQLFYTPHKNPAEVSQPKAVETWQDYSEQARKQSKKLSATMKRLKAAGIQYDFHPKPKAARPEGGMHQRFNEAGEAAPAPAPTPGPDAAAGKGKGAKQTGGAKEPGKAKEQKQKRKEKVGKVDGQGEKSAGDAEAGTQEQEGNGVKEVQAEGGDGLAETKVSSGGVSEATVEGEEKTGGEEDVVARAKAVAARLKQEADKFAQVLGKDAVDAEEGGTREGGAGEDDVGAEAVDEPWSDEHEEEEELLHEEQDVEEEEDEQSDDSEGEGGSDVDGGDED